MEAKTLQSLQTLGNYPFLVIILTSDGSPEIENRRRSKSRFRISDEKTFEVMITFSAWLDCTLLLKSW